MVSGKDIFELIALFIGGAGGGLVRQIIIGRGNIVLWRYWEDRQSGKRGVDLGILASIIIGGIVGLIVDQSMMMAFSWGLSGSYVLEEIMKREMNPPRSE